MTDKELADGLRARAEDLTLNIVEPIPQRRWKFHNAADANGEIWRLQGLLQMKKYPPTFNIGRANTVICRLEEMLVEKGISTTAQTAVAVPVPIAVVTAPAAVASLPAKEDAALSLDALCNARKSGALRDTAEIVRLEKLIAGMKPGLDRACLESRLAKLKA